MVTSEHLSKDHLDLFLDHRLTPDALLRFDIHVAACVDCRQQVAVSMDVTGMFQTLLADVQAEERLTPSHVSYEQIDAYLEGELDHVQQADVDRHIDACLNCGERVKALRIVRSELSLDQVYGPLVPAPRFPLRILLAGLLAPKGAFGDGSDGNTAVVEFPITDGGKPIPGLQGLLQRNGREYFARISMADPQERLFSNRSVHLTIGEPNTEPLLSRQLDIGVVILLGTDLKLSDTSAVGAELVPQSNDEAAL